MTYRDETLILREKLGEMRDEAARLEGRAAGLARAVAEAEEQAETAARALARWPLEQKARRGTASALGWIGGCLGMFVFFGGACIAIPLACEIVLPVHDAEYEATVAAGDDTVPTGSACTVTLEQEEEEEPCHARVVCAGRPLYRGEGKCGEPSRAEGVDYWQHGPDGLVVSGGQRVAILRRAQRGTLVLRITDD